MVIHFVCRGNAFRSIIAEAYLNSLRLKNVESISSGTVASEYKDANAVNFPKTIGLLHKHGIDSFAKSNYADQLTQGRLSNADVVIFLNKIAYEEGRQLCKLPEKIIVWDVADLGEEGRIATTDQERKTYSEDVYEEISGEVDAFVRENDLRS